MDGEGADVEDWVQSRKLVDVVYEGEEDRWGECGVYDQTVEVVVNGDAWWCSVQRLVRIIRIDYDVLPRVISRQLLIPHWQWIINPNELEKHIRYDDAQIANIALHVIQRHDFARRLPFCSLRGRTQQTRRLRHIADGRRATRCACRSMRFWVLPQRRLRRRARVCTIQLFTNLAVIRRCRSGMMRHGRG